MWEWMASYLCFVFQSFMVHGKKEIYVTTRDLLTRGIRNFTILAKIMYCKTQDGT